MLSSKIPTTKKMTRRILIQTSIEPVENFVVSCGKPVEN